ncbi:hypothetical protein VOLCADRAFT_92062 [Volvox carteri f. nagariensis]|uniref:Uncharacterized protein n=1 Tax=Volvox carteri f. nagariensis TaxID=3068 RepID=D8TZ06_VOLCA|nr:uncharacterized protein VOLCADRAFT_92062 [Volvox carteri f. nagariensis]EFJ47401.1 hypothetical protein VOLCADRAFT_92062 [Volvox carteri f. nagariensis]|eukprot:XP_002951590.1 hypothetical protein VOLCADRAFT_92062 [Volvox carteri f. nagariensis]
MSAIAGEVSQARLRNRRIIATNQIMSGLLDNSVGRPLRGPLEFRIHGFHHGSQSALGGTSFGSMVVGFVRHGFVEEDEQRSLIRCLDSARLGVDTCLVDGLEALRDHLMSYIEAVAVSQADDLELVEGAMLLMEQLSLALGTVTVLPAVRKTRNSTCPGPRASSSHMADSDSASLSMSYSVSLSGEGREELLEAPQEAVADGRFSGQWQVLVTTGGGWPYGRLQYVPVIELLDISEDGRTFRLESKAGPLYLVAAGEVAWGDSGRRGREDNGDHSHPNQLDRLHLQYHATEFRVEILGRSLALPPPTPDNELRVFALAPCTALARSTAGGMQLMARPA